MQRSEGHLSGHLKAPPHSYWDGVFAFLWDALTCALLLVWAYSLILLTAAPAY